VQQECRLTGCSEKERKWFLFCIAANGWIGEGVK